MVAVKLYPGCVGQTGTRAAHTLLRWEGIGSKTATTWPSTPLEEAIFVSQGGATQARGERWCDKGCRWPGRTFSKNESTKTAVSLFPLGTSPWVSTRMVLGKSPGFAGKPWQSGTFREFDFKVAIRRHNQNDQNLEVSFVESPKDTRP